MAGYCFFFAVWCFLHFLHISDPALAMNQSLPSNPSDMASTVRTNLHKLTVKQLQAELREIGLPVSGRKAALVDRLLEIKEGPWVTGIRRNLQDLTVKQLQAELRDRDLPVSGRKAALVDRLLERKTTTVWVRALQDQDCACQQLFLLPASLRPPGISLVFALHVLTCVVLAHMLDATQLRTHVPCYSTACARTVRILHGWGGGEGGWAWLRALSWHTCWSLCNCAHMFHATQLHVLVLFVYCADGVGVGGVGVVACVVVLAHKCWMLRNCAHMFHATQLRNWSHLKIIVPKNLRTRSKSDRCSNPRMEQYVYSYMWRFNNRNWWKQLGELCEQQ